MNHDDPEARTQAEVQEEASSHRDDPITRREALEKELMDQGASGVGEHIGQEAP